MKATEVLRQYAAGERNFQGVNLRGLSFKGQDLSGADFSNADFSGADIRCTNFKLANLQGVNFSRAIIGLDIEFKVQLMFCSGLFSLFSVVFASILPANVMMLFWTSNFVNFFIGSITSIYVLLCLIFKFRKGLIYLAFAIVVAFAVSGLEDPSFTGDEAFNYIEMGAGEVAWFFAFWGFFAFTGVVFASFVGAFSIAVVGAEVFVSVVLAAIAMAVAVAIAVDVEVVEAMAINVVEDLAINVVEDLAINTDGAGSLAMAVAVVLSVAVALNLIGFYIGWRVLQEDDREVCVRRLAVDMACGEGTSFLGANLTDANFTGVTLKNCNFSKAILTGTSFQRAKKLDLAHPGETYLKSLKVQKWLIGIGTDKNFDGMNLRGVNLQGKNLIGASFVAADLSKANLQDADLSRAILVQTILDQTDFTGATLTGACIADWNINSQTKLQDVKCDDIYLKGNYLKQEKKWILEDRRPYDHNKIFAPGEFAQFFQQVLETVDLIFSKGIEWTALLEAIQQFQAEVQSEELSIQAIEKKSGGAFVVSLEVPQDADKAEIERYIRQEYNAKLKVIEANYQKQLQGKDEIIQTKNEELIQAYREKSTDIIELAKNMAKNQPDININVVSGDSYKSKTAGILHNEKSDISGDAKIAGEINEAGQQEKDK